MLADLWDLVLPAPCPGCGGAPGRPLCGSCHTSLSLTMPVPVRPRPAPPGFPSCHALGPYRGLLKNLVLGYKERGRATLARSLGERLAVVVSAAVPAGRTPVLVPVPASPSAVRRRRGDHMVGLARYAAERLRGTGRPAAVYRALRVSERPDSTGLSAAERSQVARAAIGVRAGAALTSVDVPGAACLVLVDDVLTTGATIAAACRVLGSAGLPVGAAAVVAVTERRSPPQNVAAGRSLVPDI